jgi:integrase
MRRTKQNGWIERRHRVNSVDVWVYRYREPQPDGNSTQRSVVVGGVDEFPTENDAWTEAGHLRLSANPDSAASTVVTFQALAGRYRTDELPELRHSTQLACNSYLDRHVLPKWGDYPVASIKTLAVEQWLKTLPLAAKTRGNIHNLMRLIFNAAIRWEIVDKNPMTLVRVRGVSKRAKEPHVLSLQECHRLLEVLDEPHRTMVVLSIATGLRVSELFALKWSDFDWDSGTMFVNRAVVDGVVDDVKTKYSRAGLPLVPALAGMLILLRRISAFDGDEDWVFASSRTFGQKPLRSTAILHNYLKPAARRVGLGLLGWHTFRRTFSTLLRSNGEDIKVQQELMRHADIRTTMNLYTQAVSSQKREAQGKIVQMVLAGKTAVAPSLLPEEHRNSRKTKEIMVGAIGFEPMTSTV